jgi:sugar/nucleoside kinase (ribokinase family)
MNLWINITRPRLMELLGRIDMLLLNDSEAREITEETNLIRAGRRLREMGPAYVAIKKGEHGCLLFGEKDFFSCPAFPLEEIHDPTGAGDAFAGGLAGYLAKSGSAQGQGKVDFHHLCQGVVYGSVMASFSVEAFSVDRLRTVTPEQIRERFEFFQRLSTF